MKALRSGGRAGPAISCGQASLAYERRLVRRISCGQASLAWRTEGPDAVRA